MTLAFLALGLLIGTALASHNAPSVNTWCGKAYERKNDAFNPGGWLKKPRDSTVPLLDLRFRPRMSFYTTDDEYGTFLVDAPISYLVGQPFNNDTDSRAAEGLSSKSSVLLITITDTDSGKTLISNGRVPVDTKANELAFSLNAFKPRTAPYKINLTGKYKDKKKPFTAHSWLYYHPRNTKGTIVVLDSLHGNLLVPDKQESTKNTSNAHLVPFFPYSFYASYSAFEGKPSNVQAYKSKGYNIVHVVPDDTHPYGFDQSTFSTFLDACDAAGLLIMYDMRWTYQNTTSVAHQIETLKHHRSLLLWYTADEPDGTSDPLDATQKSYTQIRTADPYHPVSLVLNCFNYHYAAYSAGADIIMEDVYPIGINATFSTTWHTPCNRTYGDCGCDDCSGNLRDISTRVTNLQKYQSWLPGRPPKPVWGVPQAFGGSEYWARPPTADEEVAMTLLRVNHGARGIVMWTYPTTDVLEDVTSRLGPVLTGEKVTKFTLGSDPVEVRVLGADGQVDAAVWRVGKEMLVSVVRLVEDDVNGALSIKLPNRAAESVEETFWGTSWRVKDGRLVKTTLKGFESDLFVVKVE